MVRVIASISSRRSFARKAGFEEYERRRKEIIARAASVFREKGFEAANLAEIARKAGMDRTSIYYYYKSKKELFRELVGEAYADSVVMAEEIAELDATPSSKVRLLIERLFEIYEARYPYLFIYIQEDMTTFASGKTAWNAKMRLLAKRFDQAIVKIVQAGLDDGSFYPEGDARLITAGIIGMCNWSHRWFEPGKHDRSKITANFSNMILRGLSKDDT